MIRSEVRKFTLPSSLALQAFFTVLNSEAFLEEFFDENRALLTKHYTICTRFLKNHSIRYIPSNAGYFIWIDLSAYLDTVRSGKTQVEKEQEMSKRLLDNGVYLAPSEGFLGDSGWFRITFSAEKDVLELAFKRCRKMQSSRWLTIES